jgi:hypothetical protein
MRKPLNIPREIRVLADKAGVPVAVIRGSSRRVEQIVDTWRIDDEWWRQEVSRLYFRLVLHGGIRLTVFQDLISGNWYEQRG